MTKNGKSDAGKMRRLHFPISPPVDSSIPGRGNSADAGVVVEGVDVCNPAGLSDLGAAFDSQAGWPSLTPTVSIKVGITNRGTHRTSYRWHADCVVSRSNVGIDQLCIPNR